MPTAGAGQQSLGAGTPDCCAHPTHNTSVPGFPVEAGAGTSNLFRDGGRFIFEACEEDLGLGLGAARTEGPQERLLEHTVRALSVMLRPMGGGSQLPSQVGGGCGVDEEGSDFLRPLRVFEHRSGAGCEL